ncbi:hypothetical protein AC578_3209 [Pseudocercospora eumusae]|uniref:Ubiquitin-like domain-containing protein n=1 Tax=Pseudocercospora eumusae TaxID=321146 RepID=A0A139H5K9_9PEZI|nr:hypothetical protein AC578_3209 [Pseudocercospora eumusae]
MDAPDADGPPPPPVDAAPAQRTSTPITLTFRDHRGFEQSFKLKTSTKLGRAMDAFSVKVERDRKALRFLFDGERVLDESSVEEMGMEDGDTVDVLEEQVGGFA